MAEMHAIEIADRQHTAAVGGAARERPEIRGAPVRRAAVSGTAIRRRKVVKSAD